MNLLTQLKKVLATSATVAVLAMTLVVSPSARAFNDVPADAWFAPYVEALTAAGVFKAQDNFRPADNMNRAEFVKTLVEAAKVSTTGAVDAGFTDVATSDWFAPYVNAAVTAGIINGVDKSSTFRPMDSITRAEAVKIALNAFGIDYAEYASPAAAFTDTKGHWAELMVTAAYNLSMVDGQGGSQTVFDPNASISRSAVAKVAAYAVIVSEDPASYVRFDDGASAFSVFEASEVVSQVTSILGVAEETTEEGTTSEETTNEETTNEETVVASDGTLEVSLSPSSPSSTTLPGNLAGITIAQFDFTANGDDVVASSLALHRGGLSNDDTLTNVALYVDGARVSKVKTFTSADDVATLTFVDGGLRIMAGETVTVSVVAEIPAAAASGDEFVVELVAAAAVTTNAQSVIGDFPVVSSTMKVSSVDAGGITIGTDGSVTNPKVGENAVEIFKFKIDGASDTDIKLSSITFESDGTFDEDADLANFVLETNGETVATAATLSGDYLSFVFSTPFTIAEDKTQKFKVKADIVSGAGKTVSFLIDEKLDVTAIDQKYGTGAGVTMTAVDAAGELGTLTLQAGALSLDEVDATSTKIRENKTNAVLGSLKLTSNGGANLEIDGIGFKFTSTGGDNVSALLENVELYNAATGIVYDLARNGAAGATELFEDDNIGVTIPSTGSLTLEVRADTVESITAFDTNTITLSMAASNVSSNANGWLKVLNTEDDETVTDITPSSLSWKTVDGSESSATVTKLSLSAAKTAVIGTTDVEAMRFEIEADESSYLTFDELVIDGTAAVETFDKNIVSAVKLYKGSVAAENLLDTVSGSNIAAEQATFDGFNVKIDADAKVTFIVTVSIVDSASIAADRVQVGIATDATNLRLSLEDDESDDVDVAGAAILDSGRLITVSGVGTLGLVVDTTDSEVDKTKNILGDATSAFVASYEFTATNENVQVEDMILLSTQTGGETVAFKDAVKEVILYANDKITEIDRESVTGTTVTFSNINNFIVEQGSENVYVKVVTHKIGKDQVGDIADAGYTLELTVTEAQGVDSGKDVDVTAIDADGNVGESNGFAVLSTRISNVEFVSTFGGVSVASKLNSGSNNVAIIKVTTDASTNNDEDTGAALKTVLEDIKLDVYNYDGTGIGTGISAMTIEKINGNAAAIAATLAANGAGGAYSVTADNAATDAYFNLSGTDYEVDNGTSAYYLVKATVTKDTTADNDDYIKVQFDALNSSNVVFKSNDTSNAVSITDLRIGQTKIDGTQINE